MWKSVQCPVLIFYRTNFSLHWPLKNLIEQYEMHTIEILFVPLMLLYSAWAQFCQAQISQLRLACDSDNPVFVTCDAGLPEDLDNVGVEDQHQDEGKDVEEDSLEDAVE